MVTYIGGVNGEPREYWNETEGNQRTNSLSPVSGGGNVEVDVSAAVTVESEREDCLHD